MLSVTHRLYAMKYWVTVVNTSHRKYCLSCMLCVHTDIYIYMYIYTHAKTHNAHAKTDRKMSHAIVTTRRQTETYHMHNMAGQQAKAQEKHFSSAARM